MRALSPDEEEMVRAMKRVNVSGPSAELKERVLCAARDAWEEATETAAAVGWVAALAPVAASAVAACLLVMGSGHVAQRSLAPWQSSAVRAARMGTEADWRWGALDERPFLKRLASQTPAARPERAAAAFETYRSRLHELIDAGTAPGALEPDASPAESQSGFAAREDAYASVAIAREGEAA